MEPKDYNKEIKVYENDIIGYPTFFDKTHPLSHSNGRVYYYRHVASVKLGRWVTDDEHVHHIDENRKNNHPDNLKILSKSDHNKEHRLRTKSNIICNTCGKEFYPYGRKSENARYCSVKCVPVRKKFDISTEELHNLVWSKSLVKIGKELGVSDVAVKKRCKKLGIQTPPRGYWN